MKTPLQKAAIRRRPFRQVVTLPIRALIIGIEAAGFGVQGTTLFEGTDTDIPSSSITGPAIVSVLESGGTEDAVTHNGDKVAFPHFQITVRHSRYPTANALAHSIHAWASHKDRRNATIGTRFWLWIRPMQRPFGRGKDASGRALITFNVRTALRD